MGRHITFYTLNENKIKENLVRMINDGEGNKLSFRSYVDDLMYDETERNELLRKIKTPYDLASKYLISKFNGDINELTSAELGVAYRWLLYLCRVNNWRWDTIDRLERDCGYVELVDFSMFKDGSLFYNNIFYELYDYIDEFENKDEKEGYLLGYSYVYSTISNRDFKLFNDTMMLTFAKWSVIIDENVEEEVHNQDAIDYLYTLRKNAKLMVLTDMLVDELTVEQPSFPFDLLENWNVWGAFYQHYDIKVKLESYSGKILAIFDH